MTARWSRDPDMAVRLARLTLRLPCDIDDDDWSRIDGGLPWPASMVRAALPAAGYGAAVLDQLAGIFATGDLDRLETIRFGFGPDRPDDLASAPIAGAVDLTED